MPRQPPWSRLAVILFILAVLTSLTHSSTDPLDRLSQLGRQCFKTAIPCVMFSNGVGSYGCAQCDSNIKEATVLEFGSRASLQIFIDSRRPARVIMVPEYVFFNTLTQASLDQARNIAAIIVYPGQPQIDSAASPIPFPDFPVFPSWSVDQQEPNLEYNRYAKAHNDKNPFPERNTNGSEIKFKLYPFNVFHIDVHVAAVIRNLSRKFFDTESLALSSTQTQNRSSTAPRFKIQSLGRMFACPSPTATSSATALRDLIQKVNSSTCLEEKTCLPIGGQSVWSALGRVDPGKPSEERKILAIIAPMDSMAFFSDFSLGASAEISSLAVQMAVAQAVAKYRNGVGKDKVMLRQPVYFAFNAQSWAYAGSSRFLKDLTTFECINEYDHTNGDSGCENPYMPSLKFLDFRDADISVLNLGQLIAPSTSTKLNFSFYSHAQRDSRMSGVEKALDSAFKRRNERKTDQEVSLTQGVRNLLPLDASQSFARYYKSTSDIVSITNYDEQFKNLLYHSMYDNETLTKDQGNERVPMRIVASVIADAVISIAFNDTTQSSTANGTLIDNVLYCMTTNWTYCGLAAEYLGPYHKEAVGQVIPGNYPGSFFPATRLRDRHPSGAAKLAFIRSFFAFHNSYNASGRCENAMEDCKDFRKSLNTNATNQSSLHSVFCTKGQCVASDTNTHNAFGAGIMAVNKIQTEFKLATTPLPTFNGTNPREGDWTESVWDPELGLCGYVEDSTLYGWLIVGSGVIIFVVCLIVVCIFDAKMFKAERSGTTVDEETPMLTSHVPLPPPRDTSNA